MSELSKAGKIIAVINEKGGVGKTHTTIQMAFILASANMRVLVIDNDSSFDATTALTGGNIPEEISEVFKPKGVANTFNLYVKDMALIPVRVRENIDLFGATERLITVSGEDATLSFIDATEKLAKDYDYILIDCPPSIGTQSSAALKAADAILIPCLADSFSFKGAVTILTRLKAAQKRERKAAKILGIFVNRLKKPMANSVRDVVEIMQEQFGSVFLTYENEPLTISETVKQTDAMAQGLSVIETAPNSNAAIEMVTLVKEVLDRMSRIDEINNEYQAYSDSIGRAY